MDICAQLDALLGQSVNLDDQTRVEPEVFIGILVGEPDGYYTVVADGQEVAGFYSYEVVQVIGHGIRLEAPEPLNSEWDESDLPRSDADLEDEEGW
jgi:hypothetical protein